jgi:hypothetical protein
MTYFSMEEVHTITLTGHHIININRSSRHFKIRCSRQLTFNMTKSNSNSLAKLCSLYCYLASHLNKIHSSICDQFQQHCKSGSCYVQVRVDPTCHSHPHLFLLPVDPTAGSSLRSARHGAIRAPGSGAAHPCPSSRSSPSRCSGHAPLPQHPMPPARPCP